MIIYKATNSINGKVYIGQTTRTLEERKKRHIFEMRNDSTYFHNSLKKYGTENFVWRIIDVACDMIELNDKEKYWINYYNATNKNVGYNHREGGAHGKHNQESREKNRLSHLGKKLSEEHKRKIGEASKRNGSIPPNRNGFKTPEATKIKISLAQKGRKQPAHVIEAARIANTGRKQSRQTIEKRIQKLRGKKKPDGMMEKLRLKNIGSKRSLESRKKMSEAAKLRYARMKIS